ncbi:carbohydrate kinase family protein [Patescibacteria group bacterium]|nr:carbohydrate kinase family protein [Patescibacteria group bacterium]
MKKFQVVTIGGATQDITFRTDEGIFIDNTNDPTKQKLLAFEYGAKIISSQCHYTLGGGGTNTAAGFANLGLKVASFANIGQDQLGRQIITNLKAKKVDTSLIKADKKANSGFSLLVISGKARDHVAFLYRGANDYIDITDQDIKKFQSDWFYITSLSGLHWPRLMKEIIKAKKKKNIKIGWNPGETQLKSGKKGLDSLIKETNILVMNKDEAIELVLSDPKLPAKTKKNMKVLNNINWLIKQLFAWGPELVVLTDGKKGAYAYNGHQVHFSKILDTPVKDTTGAGDCFGSSFLAGMILFNGNIDKAIRLGIINTSYLVQKVGAQEGLMSKEQFNKHFKKK